MKTVFAVDDNDINLMFVDAALSREYRVFTLQSAEDMFGLLESVTPDLILLDVEMPGINGFDALRALKADARYADIPVVFITGYIDGDVEARGFDLGAAGFVGKPFSAPALLERVNNCLATNLEV